MREGAWAQSGGRFDSGRRGDSGHRPAGSVRRDGTAHPAGRRDGCPGRTLPDAAGAGRACPAPPGGLPAGRATPPAGPTETWAKRRAGTRPARPPGTWSKHPTGPWWATLLPVGRMESGRAAPPDPTETWLKRAAGPPGTRSKRPPGQTETWAKRPPQSWAQIPEQPERRLWLERLPRRGPPVGRLQPVRTAPKLVSQLHPPASPGQTRHRAMASCRR